ncbi:hypothetical protein ACMC56_04225 [Campylobacterota bacterium DY0563]
MLPFIAGVAAGAVAVVAYNNNKEIRDGVKTGAKKAKQFAEEGFEKTKELTKDVKATVSEKVETLKSKKKEEITEDKGEVVNGN